MNDKADVTANYLDGLWKFFASVKLTVVVLLTLAALSIVGTLIPQNQSPADYFNAFGPFLFQVLNTLDVFNMYQSWWFRFLISLLVINIVVCSIERLRLTGKVIFTRSPKFNLNNYRRIKSRKEFAVEGEIEATANQYYARLANRFRYCRMQREGSGFAITAERGRWTRLGVYGVHLSVVILLVGSLIGSIYGFEGFANIPEGEQVDTIQLRNSGLQYRLPFAIRCDDFDVQFYETGAPREFRSNLAIIEDGQVTFTKEIIVNDPLRYKGINIFQSSYGELDAAHVHSLDEEIVLNFRSAASGMIYQRTTSVGEVVKIPEGLGEFEVKGFEPHGKFKGMDIGPALMGTLTREGQPPVPLILAINFPKFDMMRQGEVVISVAPGTAIPEKRYYTGLQVTHDPGVWVVYLGFIMMIAGCMVTFFMSHQQLVVEIQPKGQKMTVLLAGKTNKNKIGYRAKLERLAQRLINQTHKPS